MLLPLHPEFYFPQHGSTRFASRSMHIDIVQFEKREKLQNLAILLYHYFGIITVVLDEQIFSMSMLVRMNRHVSYKLE